MREESREVTLGLGDVSLAPVLGPYYIDMRPARVHYTDGTYGGGFDRNGVPMVRLGDELVHLPVNIAQYGYMLHADWMETRDETALETLRHCVLALEELKSEDGEACVWWHRHREPRYGIEPPWASAMAQGQAISLYLRLYQAIGGDDLLATARGAHRFMERDWAEGGVRRMDEAGHVWLEEYPSDPPSYVLNGFVYALLGLYDLHRVTGDTRVKADIDLCLETLEANLHRFDAGYWSIYDLRKRELVRYYYQKNVHVPQMAVLHRLTGNALFEEYRSRWERQLTPLNFLFVQLMYRVKPRWDRLRSSLGGH